jgi:hypothetical protein
MSQEIKETAMNLGVYVVVFWVMTSCSDVVGEKIKGKFVPVLFFN